MTPKHFTLTPTGPFSMKPIRDMQCGFLRGSRTCSADPSRVRLAFPLDRTFDVVGVELSLEEGRVKGEVFGAGDAGRVREHVARGLGLDHDGQAVARVVHADPKLRAVARANPGFRPVVAYSAYAMAGWCVLSQRLRMSQAAAIQVRLSEAVGDVVEV